MTQVHVVIADYYAGGPHETMRVKAFLDQDRAQGLVDLLMGLAAEAMRGGRGEHGLANYQSALAAVREVWPECHTLHDLTEFWVDSFEVEE